MKIVVVGGADQSIYELIEQAHQTFEESLNFILFDTHDQVPESDLYTYYGYDKTSKMVEEAMRYVQREKADVILKGMVQTHDILKGVLNKEFDLRNKKVLSHVALIELPEQSTPLFLTDAAMNIQPTKEQLAQITDNAIETALNFGIKQPKVALLSSAENYNEKMPSSVLAVDTKELLKKRTDAVIEGPISFDLSLNPKAAQKKKYQGAIQGDANILVVPTIDVGNVLYKAFVQFAHANVGGIIVGAKIPIALTSRADSVESKLTALKLAMKQVK